MHSSHENSLRLEDHADLGCAQIFVFDGILFHRRIILFGDSEKFCF